MRTTGKQCGLAATGVYQPSLRSPWLAAKEQEIRLREDVMEQSGSRLESLIDERLAELKDSVRESQEA
ncbi:hypothetical protein, partial [Thiolapillus sp.]|uniref:hypothetical protein n=1 Tax=Thiolapillus sp. TaxID=2017437 RepID=UPI003AF69098